MRDELSDSSSSLSSGCLLMGHPDELSSSVRAEMDAHFGYGRFPDDQVNAELDAIWAEQQVRAEAKPAPSVSFYVARAGKGYAASVRVEGRTVKLGRHGTERAAWEACEAYARSIQRAA